MIQLLLLIYLIYIFGTLYVFYRKEYGVYQLPFLIACVNLTFILPQLVSIMWSAEDASYMSLSLFCIISCNVALNWGFGLRLPTGLKRHITTVFTKRVNYFIIAYITIGFIAYMMNRGVYRGGQIGGTYVIINFFIGLLQYALILVFLSYRNRTLGKKWFFLLAAFVLMIYLDKTLMTGRRNDAIRIILIASYFIFYTIDRYKLYIRFRWIVPAFFILGMIGNTQIVEYRSNAYNDSNLSDNISQLNFAGAMNSILSNDKGEVNNCIIGINSCYDYGQYDFGAYDWNRIVHDFVPKALVGGKTKEDMMIAVEYSGMERKLTRFGSTLTGYFDAFASFGFFGFIKFALIGMFMGWLWRRQEHSQMSKLLYFGMLTNTLHIVTHTTSYFSNALIFFGLFIFPFLSLIQKKYNERNTCTTGSPSPVSHS